jgi:hypothetical protein
MMMPSDLVETMQPVVPPSLFLRLFKKKHQAEKKKPDGPKLKLFEIVGLRQRTFNIHPSCRCL